MLLLQSDFEIIIKSILGTNKNENYELIWFITNSMIKDKLEMFIIVFKLELYKIINLMWFKDFLSMHH